MKSFSLSLLFLLLVGQIVAQTDSDYVAKPIVIEDITKNMSKGNQPGFKIDIYQAKKAGVVDALAKAVKESNGAKVEMVNNEYVVKGAVNKTISPQPLNVYSLVNEYEDHVELFVFYEKDSVFLSKEKNESEYVAARKFTRDFAVRALKGAVQQRIDIENKKLKDLEAKLATSVKEQDKLAKGISDENHNIENTKEKITTIEKDQERVKQQVQDQKGMLDQAKTTNNEALKKDEEKKLREFESELSKLQKQEDDLHKDVTNSEASIREYQRKVSDAETAVKLNQEEVTRQKDLISKLEKRLGGIE